VVADLEQPAFLAGCLAGRWRVVAWEAPILTVAITATEPDGTLSEYGFWAELSNFPSQNPMVRIWDLQAKTPLAPAQRPQGGTRVQRAFQHWGSDTVYRPWDRMTAPHDNNTANMPYLAWRPERHLIFIFEDLHAILNSNARAFRFRTAA
jgi:hypothetical protein